MTGVQTCALPIYDAASLMAHEGTHRVLARTDNETLKEFVSTLLEKGTHPEKIRDLPVPIGIRQKLANSSIDFEDLASPDVKNYFPSYHRVTSLPELYHKGNFLEEMLADDSLATIEGRKKLAGYLDLTPEKLGKVNSLYRRLLKASQSGLENNKKLKGLGNYAAGYTPNFAGLSDAVNR